MNKRQLMVEAEEERMRKAEERKKRKKKDSTGELFGNKDHVEYSCPHCGFEAKVNETLALQLFYCKRCMEVQTQPTKKVVETVVEKENRGFWQWLFHKPTTTKRCIHADMVPCSPQCYKCKRTDMMVPFDQEHCPVCGNLLERHDNLFN